MHADKVEAVLQERARLDYTAAVVRETMQTTKSTAQRLRFAVAASGLARGVMYSAQHFQQRQNRQRRPSSRHGMPSYEGGGP